MCLLEGNSLNVAIPVVCYVVTSEVPNLKKRGFENQVFVLNAPQYCCGVFVCWAW